MTFDTPITGTIQDKDGNGTGFTHRLPGTGADLPTNDPNLDLSSNPGRLTITSTRSNLENSAGNNNFGIAEAYVLYITNVVDQDIYISTLVRDIHVGLESDQLCLFAGTSTIQEVRAGVHVWSSGLNPRQYFLTSNQGEWDVQEFFGPTDAFLDGDDISITLSRIAGEWNLAWNNLSTQTSGQSGFYSLPWLDEEPNLYVGIYYANPTNDNSKISQIDEFSVNIVPEPSEIYLLSIAGLCAVWYRKRFLGL